MKEKVEFVQYPDDGMPENCRTAQRVEAFGTCLELIYEELGMLESIFQGTREFKQARSDLREAYFALCELKTVTLEIEQEWNDFSDMLDNQVENYDDKHGK